METSVAIPSIVSQHAEESAFLFGVRQRLASTRHIRLRDLGRFDERLVAHLDGLSIAGDDAWLHCESALDRPSAGAMFTAAVVALRARSVDRLGRLCALAAAVPGSKVGLSSAFAWVEPRELRGTVKTLLASSDEFLRSLGFTACISHRIRLPDAYQEALTSEARSLRTLGKRACGELGLMQNAVHLKRIESDDEESNYWGAWSSALLGNRGASLENLIEIGRTDGPFRNEAFLISLQVLNVADCKGVLSPLAASGESIRWAIQGSGVTGDPYYVPWLISKMSAAHTGRLAGEAFSLITGLDLASAKLTRAAPEDLSAGLNDDPNDVSVAMDEEDGLPWPDPELIGEWWQKNAGQFAPGTRYFVGSPVTRETCLRVLHQGGQRQRHLASNYLCLLEPGTTLFDWRAAAFRQRRLLANFA